MDTTYPLLLQLFDWGCQKNSPHLKPTIGYCHPGFEILMYDDDGVIDGWAEFYILPNGTLLYEANGNLNTHLKISTVKELSPLLDALSLPQGMTKDDI